MKHYKKKPIHAAKKLKKTRNIFPHLQAKDTHTLTAISAIILFSTSISIPAHAATATTPSTHNITTTDYEYLTNNAQSITIPETSIQPTLTRDGVTITDAPKPVVKTRPAPNAAVVGEAQAYARTLVTDENEWNCLYNLLARESGWRVEAYNASSGAMGIFQALPGSKMQAFGDDYETNPITQINWGMSYIAGRYGTPCGAWAHSEEVGWY